MRIGLPMLIGTASLRSYPTLSTMACAQRSASLKAMLRGTLGNFVGIRHLVLFSPRRTYPSERARVRDRVHWSATKPLARLDVAQVLAHDIHNHKRVKIDVCLLSDALASFAVPAFRHHRPLCPRRKWERGCTT